MRVSGKSPSGYYLLDGVIVHDEWLGDDVSHPIEED